MADNDVEQQERTEQASAKRLDDARQRGQVPRSRELSASLVVLAGAAVLLLGQPYFVARFDELLQHGLTFPREALLDARFMPRALADGIAIGIKLLVPLWVAVLVAAVVGTVAFGGWAFSFEALTPKFEKLNPMSGLKRLFGWTGLSELAKALAKFLLVAAAAALVLSGLMHKFMAIGSLTLESGLEQAARLTGLSLLGFAATLVLVAAADVPFQHWQYRRQLRMTKQEAKDEHKETEGRPEVRSRVRNLQREISTRRMMAEVPKADVVAMNPTHYAVALRYDATKMKAPRVVAKGADLLAFNIRRVAEAHGVPIFEHPQFARALYHTSKLDTEISPRLYVAVAQVLTYVYQLKGRRTAARGPGVRPQTAPVRPELDIDPELLGPQRGRKPRVKADA